MIQRQGAEITFYNKTTNVLSKLQKISISLLKAIGEHLIIEGQLGSGSYN